MQLRLVEQINLTPQDADPASYLIKLESSTPLDYQPGDWLTVKGQNPQALVNELVLHLNLERNDEITLRRQGKVTIEQALTHYLELTVLDPAILNKLVRQYGFDHWASRAEMQSYSKSRDVVDLLEAFPSLAALGAEFLSLLSPLAPRYYSMASSSICYPNQIHLLYKAIRYFAQDREHVGVTSNSMAQAEIGALFEVEVKPNAHFKLPVESSIPIVMIAAGTGLAPFIGFMQQREVQQATGTNLMYFGETHQQTRFLCQSQLAGWQQQGLLTLDTAFSRDQSQKIYVQDRLLHNQAWLDVWQAGGHIYICGDKAGLAQGVEQQIKTIWMQRYGWQQDQANQAWLDAKKQKRIQMDVY